MTHRSSYALTPHLLHPEYSRSVPRNPSKTSLGTCFSGAHIDDNKYSVICLILQSF